MATQIADRLRNTRRQRVVGREAELALVQDALNAAVPSFFVLNFYGPGGIGKSTLLQAVADLCYEQNIPCVALNAQEVEPSPEGFLAALGSEALETLRNATTRRVLLLDHYEALESLEIWLRQTLLPTFSGETLILLAGRNPVSSSWRGDVAWHGLLKTVSLRNLSPEDARRFLAIREIPETLVPSVLSFTHGYPLALALFVEVHAQRGNLPQTPDEAPPQDVVSALLERFIEKTPTPLHRTALEVCALLRITTEPILAWILEVPDCRELFEWLRGLSFVETVQPGIAPHGVAREALLADLRWRSPDRYADFHKRARAYYTSRIAQSEPREQQRLLWDYIFLHRDNAVVRSAFTWQDNAGFYAERAQESDGPALRALVALHEGESSARHFDHWFAQPAKQTTFVFRAAGEDQLRGMLLQISLERCDEADFAADPAIAAAWTVVERNAPLRPGETATHFRFWMAADTYQEVSTIQSMIVVNCVRHYLTTPGLVYSFFPCALPERYEAVFAYAEMKACPAADYWLGLRHHSAYAYNWRQLAPLSWLAVLADKETQLTAPSAAPPSRNTPSLLALSREVFEEAVRHALKRFDHPERLVHSPLLCARIVVERAGGASAAPLTRAEALRALLRDRMESLRESPRRERAFRVLDRTFLRPAATQEKAAEVLDLPFSTYRRHLAEGISAITESLWQLELDAGLR